MGQKGYIWYKWLVYTKIRTYFLNVQQAIHTYLFSLIIKFISRKKQSGLISIWFKNTSFLFHHSISSKNPTDFGFLFQFFLNFFSSFSTSLFCQSISSKKPPNFEQFHSTFVWFLNSFLYFLVLTLWFLF